MKATVYLSRKLLNQLKVKETESKDLMLTHNLHNIIINGKRVGCSGHIQNVLNNKCVYVSTEKSCYQPLSDKNMVRYAASMKDYSSVSLGAKGRNQFVTNDELVGKIIISIAAMTVSSASSMGKRVILMHSTTVHGFLPTQTLLQNSMANRFLSRNPTRNSTKPIFGPSLPLGLKQT